MRKRDTLLGKGLDILISPKVLRTVEPRAPFVSHNVYLSLTTWICTTGRNKYHWFCPSAKSLIILTSKGPKFSIFCLPLFILLFWMTYSQGGTLPWITTFSRHETMTFLVACSFPRNSFISSSFVVSIDHSVMTSKFMTILRVLQFLLWRSIFFFSIFYTHLLSTFQTINSDRERPITEVFKKRIIQYNVMTCKTCYHVELGMGLSWGHISSSILGVYAPASTTKIKNKKMNQDFLIISRIHKLAIWCFPDTE